MCHRGYVMPIKRNDINRIECGPLRKCSFEETLDMILEAAAYGSVDALVGVSEKIMLGQLCKIGTGCFDIVIDVKKLSEPRYLPDAYIQQDEESRIDQPFEIESLNTPINPNTPAIFGGITPGGLTTGYYGTDGAAFTPQPNLTSPIYSPYLRGSLPGSPKTSDYNSPLGLMDTNSVIYSPRSSNPTTHYIPTSPHYQATNSPSLSPSDRGTRIYSPSSPAYSNSPRYSPGYR